MDSARIPITDIEETTLNHFYPLFQHGKASKYYSVAKGTMMHSFLGDLGIKELG